MRHISQISFSITNTEVTSWLITPIFDLLRLWGNVVDSNSSKRYVLTDEGNKIFSVCYE